MCNTGTCNDVLLSPDDRTTSLKSEVAMVSTGVMIIMLLIFIIAIGASFYGGFFIGKKTVQPVIVKHNEPLKQEAQENPVLEEGNKQTFMDRIYDLIEDMAYRKKKEEGNKEVKMVTTVDGISKPENNAY